MRANVVIFAILTVVFVAFGITYTIWAEIVYGRPEFVGTIGLFLVALMALFIGFYLARSFRAQGGSLPEDRQDASIDDGDPEMGNFSPWSWWPLMLGATAALAFTGLAAGIWLMFIAGALFIVSIVGWVYEYYRGFFAR